LLGAALFTVSTHADAVQCVPFARNVSGIGLRGDAWTWWAGAIGIYDRGQLPKVGAVMVFKRFGSLRHGHVAVVRQIINSRHLYVDHANWGHGRVSTMVAVADVSLANDWSQVRVWNGVSQDFGIRIYPTYGFIYPRASRGILLPVDLTVVREVLPPPKTEQLAGAPTAEPPPALMADATPPPTPAPILGSASAATESCSATEDGVWPQDADLARQFGSGHY
jgi:surface antigen